MNMAFERSLRHLTGRNILNSHSAEELAQLAKDYPYFAPAQFLLTAQLKNTGDDFAYTTQLQKASLYSSNPFWLQYQLANITNDAAAANTLEEDYSNTFVTAEPAANEQTPSAFYHSTIEIPTLETAIALSQYKEEERPVTESTEAPKEEHIPQEGELTKDGEYIPISFVPYPYMPEPDEQPVTETISAVTEAAEPVKPVAEETFEYASILTTIEEEETIPTATEAIAAPAEEPVATEKEYAPIEFVPYPYMPEPDEPATSAPETTVLHTAAEETTTEAASLPTDEPYTFFFAEKDQDEPMEENNNVVFLSEQYSHLYGEEEDTEEEPLPGTDEEDSIAAQKISSVLNSQLADFNKPVEEDARFSFEAEPSHLVDYFASQGIKIDLTTEPQDKLTSHLRSFTSWLKKMKRPEIQDLDTDPRLENAVQDIARTSIESREIVTETMADVFIKQGQIDKAIQLYIKLSFLDPDKTVYFANKIQQLKGI